MGADGYTIDLSLSPEVVDFDGFVNYGSPILGAQGVFIGGIPVAIQNTIITPNVINQPIFSTRKVTTSVSIWDGQTVALGGLIREDVQKVQDKVPLLGDIPIAGRLFRSNVEEKIKSRQRVCWTPRANRSDRMKIKRKSSSRSGCHRKFPRLHSRRNLRENRSLAFEGVFRRVTSEDLP